MHTKDAGQGESQKLTSSRNNIERGPLRREPLRHGRSGVDRAVQERPRGRHLAYPVAGPLASRHGREDAQRQHRLGQDAEKGEAAPAGLIRWGLSVRRRAVHVRRSWDLEPRNINLLVWNNFI